MYFDDSIHRTLQCPYYEVSHDGNKAYLLFFTQDWADKNKLIRGNMDLLITILDQETGKTAVYKSGYCAYDSKRENLSGIAVFDQEWKEPELCCLQPYFYQDHECPCHRKQYAEEAGLWDGKEEPIEDWEDEMNDGLCSGNRFKYVSIASLFAPDVVLYSETMSEEELMGRLK